MKSLCKMRFYLFKKVTIPKAGNSSRINGFLYFYYIFKYVVNSHPVKSLATIPLKPRIHKSGVEEERSLYISRLSLLVAPIQ
jgi:hypothetical protein